MKCDVVVLRPEANALTGVRDLHPIAGVGLELGVEFEGTWVLHDHAVGHGRRDVKTLLHRGDVHVVIEGQHHRRITNHRKIAVGHTGADRQRRRQRARNQAAGNQHQDNRQDPPPTAYRRSQPASAGGHHRHSGNLDRINSTGRTGYLTHSPDSTATAIRLVERPAYRFSSRTIPPRLGLRHHQPREQQLLHIEEDVQHPDRVPGDIAIEGPQQLAAEGPDEPRDLVHQRGRDGPALVLDDVLDRQEEVVYPPHIRPPPNLLVTPVGRRLKLAMYLVDRVAQHRLAPFTNANTSGSRSTKDDMRTVT